MNNSGILRGLVIAGLSVALMACGVRKLESDLGIDGAPDWVNAGSQALSDNGGKLFHGVGWASTMDDTSLQKSTADNRARADLAAVLNVYMDAVIADYAATAGSGDRQFNEQSVSRQIDSATRMHLTGARIVASWRDPNTDIIYSLAELDLDRVREIVATVEDMDPGLRRHIRERGTNVFDQVSGGGS